MKRKRIQQTLKLMRVIKLKGRAERLGGECISTEEFQNGLKESATLRSSAKVSIVRG